MGWVGGAVSFEIRMNSPDVASWVRYLKRCRVGSDVGLFKFEVVQIPEFDLKLSLSQDIWRHT